MTPEHVLQERKDRLESRARPFTQEEDDADLEMMEALYQEHLLRKDVSDTDQSPTLDDAVKP